MLTLLLDLHINIRARIWLEASDTAKTTDKY